MKREKLWRFKFIKFLGLVETTSEEQKIKSRVVFKIELHISFHSRPNTFLISWEIDLLQKQHWILYSHTASTLLQVPEGFIIKDWNNNSRSNCFIAINRLYPRSQNIILINCFLCIFVSNTNIWYHMYYLALALKALN